MKIEKICSKQDLVDNLKKAAKYSKVTHLRKLAEYVQQEFDLDNLKEGITLSCYDIKVSKGCYQIVKQSCQYDSEQNKWNVLKEEVVETIALEDIEAIQL